MAPSFLGKALIPLSTVTGQREKQDEGRWDPGPLFIKNISPHFLEDESRKAKAETGKAKAKPCVLIPPALTDHFLLPPGPLCMLL